MKELTKEEQVLELMEQIKNGASLSDVIDLIDQNTKPLIDKIDRLKFQLKAADSDYQKRIEELESKLNKPIISKCGKCEMLGDSAPCDECYYSGKSH